jgi:hypothetical protein
MFRNKFRGLNGKNSYEKSCFFIPNAKQIASKPSVTTLTGLGLQNINAFVAQHAG